MKYAVVYVSPTGNTKMLAEAIKTELGEEGCVYFGTPEENISDADIVFAGFWTDKGTCSEEMALFLKAQEGKKVFLFGTAGFGGAPEYFEQILSSVKENLPESAELAGTFMCQGKMPSGVRKRYESMLEQNPDDERTKGLIVNFDKALSHPDQTDMKRLKEALGAINKK